MLNKMNTGKRKKRTWIKKIRKKEKGKKLMKMILKYRKWRQNSIKYSLTLTTTPQVIVMDFDSYFSMVMVHSSKAKRQVISKVVCLRNFRLWHLIPNANNNNSLGPLQMSWLWKLSHQQKIITMKLMAREVPITTAQWKLSNLSKREIWNETLRQCSAKNQLRWLWMVTYLRPLSTVRWLMNRYKLQIKMSIKISKMINRKNRCSTLLRTSRTWDMLLTCRLVEVETKTFSLDSKRIKLNKLLLLANLLCQEAI